MSEEYPIEGTCPFKSMIGRKDCGFTCKLYNAKTKMCVFIEIVKALKELARK